MKKILIITVFWLHLVFLIPAGAYAQHHPHYSQYMLNGLAINPAYTGSHEVFTLSALYRKQWINMPGSPGTQTLSAHAPLKKKFMAVGLLIYNDNIGVTRNTSFFADYAYRLKLGKGKLCMGLSGGIQMVRSNWQSVPVSETGDPLFENSVASGIVPNVGFGLYYYTKNYHAGFSIPELLSHKQQMSANRFKTYHDFSNYNYLLNAGIKIPVGQTIKLEPSFLFKYHSNSPAQIDVNLVAGYKDMFYLGISYRTGDALVALIEYRINNQFMAGYAFDYTLSDLNKYNNGSHEIMLRYEFSYKVKASDPRLF